MESEKVKEIKKALECCTNLKEKCDNEKCYLFDKLEYHYCERQLKQDLLTLIKELACENERLRTCREADYKTMTALRQANTELNECMDEMQDRIAELEEYIKGNEQDAKAFVNGWHKDLETELKQFAEKVAKRLININGIKQILDETLKEFIDAKNSEH